MILNYMKVSETIASSGQPKPNEFEMIARDGYINLVNLALPDSSYALPDEGGLATESGMDYFHLPVPFDNPQPAHLKKFLKLMAMLQPEKTWVHCAMNYRVSAFMFQYYRLILKLPENIANKVIFPDWQPNQVWQQLMALELYELDEKAETD